MLKVLKEEFKVLQVLRVLQENQDTLVLRVIRVHQDLRIEDLRKILNL